jgi:hypothetical protein
MWWVLLLGLARAEVVDRVVAVVEGLPVLVSEIGLEAAITAIDPSQIPFWAAADPERTAIDGVIVRYVAADVALYQPSRDAVAERVDALRNTFPDPASWGLFLAAHGLDEARIEVVVRRRMIVERFLLRNVQSNPAERDAWLAECEDLVARLRPQIRLRMIPAREPAP